ncbi:hypothetical protein A1O7_07266 [Cladophialophora yegresii CBS 114405]|uniref:Uncharacterized protein n=1 Tax=Cladophialophora yegresii CBS 114405 TaxID=1182544 RepID=W9VML0_9EURO|nr:uncharacterized protein A1O7_07266 [Cladophialophora yegresii CBS 114405]EXJ56922.1 hypothetical protein A1O7_07266 [Cladophialophora yegresii CBS 114405]
MSKSLGSCRGRSTMLPTKTNRFKGSKAQFQELQESLRQSQADVQQREVGPQELKAKIADKETSNVEFNLSIANLQAQLQDNNVVETALRLRVEELLQAMSTTEAQARNFQQSNITLREHLQTTEQNLSVQIQVLATLHEQHLTATKELTATRSELERHRNQLDEATATTNNLQLANAALQTQLERERARTELEASKRWKARLRDLAHKHSASSLQRPGETSTVREVLEAMQSMTPNKITNEQVERLAGLCLCHRHGHQLGTAKNELQNRLRYAVLDHDQVVHDRASRYSVVFGVDEGKEDESTSSRWGWATWAWKVLASGILGDGSQ